MGSAVPVSWVWLWHFPDSLRRGITRGCSRVTAKSNGGRPKCCIRISSFLRSKTLNARLRRAFLLWRSNEGYPAPACPLQHIADSYLGGNTLATGVWVVINGLYLTLCACENVSASHRLTMTGVFKYHMTIIECKSRIGGNR